ncbi:hypothetical protein ARMSODRAFT_1024593 [Armillaria solidipes]|uniref:Uncharacterized protein n=1 Tax=Armillaria solidipes TaxID=1076256 RepID=A0A2H3AVR7_9AGAR|nr:hypothetical protein ARMSODRAFT_1024593 [Armillaria solidipes]
MSSPTRDQDQRWAARWWHPAARQTDEESTQHLPLMNPFRLRNHPETQPPAPAMYPEPLFPPQRRTTGTYGLTTNSSPLPPTIQMTYHPRNGPWYQSDPVPSWLSPQCPASASSYDPPPDLFQMSPAAWRMISSETLRTQTPDPPEDLRPQCLDTPDWLRPHGQLEGSQNEASPSPPTMRTTSTPSPYPYPYPLPDLEAEATSSTQTALTMSGLHSLPLTKKSSGPNAPRPGSYKEAMSRLATISERATKPPWTSTSQQEKSPYPNRRGRRSSPHGSSLTETEKYTARDQGLNYTVNTGRDTRMNNATWTPMAATFKASNSVS